jgi:Undecaprenyl-phosphate galactose phosphotransferase WbaP
MSTQYQEEVIAEDVKELEKRRFAFSSAERRALLLNLPGLLIKRLYDITVSLILLILLSPMLGICAFLIKITSPGPVLYFQKRVGKNGDRFNFVKFRSMYLDSKLALRKIFHENPELRAEWDQYQKLCDDPRVTSVGKFLRRFSLDELPQLWNVFIGDMSLVGPRPFIPEQMDYYRDIYDLYVAFRPGLTGLWQVSGRNTTTYEERVRLDGEYCRNWSLWLDLVILLRTVWVVIRGKGAY